MKLFKLYSISFNKTHRKLSFLCTHECGRFQPKGYRVVGLRTSCMHVLTSAPSISTAGGPTDLFIGYVQLTILWRFSVVGFKDPIALFPFMDSLQPRAGVEIALIRINWPIIRAILGWQLTPFVPNKHITYYLIYRSKNTVQFSSESVIFYQFRIIFCL